MDVKMLSRFRLKTQVGGSFALVVVIFVISGGLSLGLILKLGTLADALLRVDQIKIAVLEVRRYEKNFLLRGDRISIDKVHGQIRLVRETAKIMKNGGSVPMAKAFYDRILDQIQIYEVSFETIASGRFSHGGGVEDSMDKSMVAAARDVLDVCSRLQDLQRYLMKRMLGRAITFLVVGIVFSVLVSFVLALLITRGVIVPIRKCAAFTRAIARGDLNQRLDVISAGSIALLTDSLINMLEQLKQRIGFVEGILNGLPVPCAVIDTQENISFINGHLLDYLEVGGTTEECIGTPWAEFVYNDSQKETLIFNAIQAGRPEKNLLFSCSNRKGNSRHARLDIALLEDMDKNAMGGFVVITDLTQIKEEQDKLSKAHLSLQSKSQELELVLHTIENQVWYIVDNIYLFANHARSSFLGRTCLEITGRKVNELVSTEEADRFIHFTGLVMARKQKQSFEIWSMNHGGELRLLSVTKVPKLDRHGHVEFIVTVAQDITEQRQMEDQLRYKSYHDQLTGLYNRYYLMEEIERLQKGRFFPLGVIFCDLDDLKLTNDSLGHEFGDRLIIKVAELMRASFRASDIIARYGGDEFVVILPKSSSLDMGNAIKRFWNSLDAYNNDHQELVVKISVGYVVSTNKNDSIQDLMKAADAKMYQEKTAKKNRTG